MKGDHGVASERQTPSEAKGVVVEDQRRERITLSSISGSRTRQLGHVTQLYAAGRGGRGLTQAPPSQRGGSQKRGRVELQIVLPRGSPEAAVGFPAC